MSWSASARPPSRAGLPPVPANAAGFLVGLLVAWGTARAFTFAPPKRGGAGLRYALAFVCCWALNAGAMSAATTLGPEALAQAGGVGVYAVSFYLACRWWVFGDAATVRGDLALLRRGPAPSRGPLA